jgi:trk system potassium uptake protein TrkH
MFIGGSAGSTGGAIKCVRILLVLKQGYRELYRLVHPHAVVQVKLGNETVPAEVMKSVLGFFVLYLAIAAVATLALCGLGLDLITSFAAMATTLGNVGPGLGLYHPATTFSQAPDAAKWILSFCMLVGRLELYTVLVLLIPEFWKK